MPSFFLDLNLNDKHHDHVVILLQNECHLVLNIFDLDRGLMHAQLLVVTTSCLNMRFIFVQ